MSFETVSALSMFQPLAVLDSLASFVGLFFAQIWLLLLWANSVVWKSWEISPDWTLNLVCVFLWQIHHSASAHSPIEICHRSKRMLCSVADTYKYGWTWEHAVGIDLIRHVHIHKHPPLWHCCSHTHIDKDLDVNFMKQSQKVLFFSLEKNSLQQITSCW